MLRSLPLFYSKDKIPYMVRSGKKRMAFLAKCPFLSRKRAGSFIWWKECFKLLWGSREEGSLTQNAQKHHNGRTGLLPTARDKSQGQPKHNRLHDPHCLKLQVAHQEHMLVSDRLSVTICLQQPFFFFQQQHYRCILDCNSMHWYACKFLCALLQRYFNHDCVHDTLVLSQRNVASVPPHRA